MVEATIFRMATTTHAKIRCMANKTNQHDDLLMELCRQLLREQEVNGRARSEITKDLGLKNQSNLNKWLDMGQGISSRMCNRILDTYGGAMNAERIRKLIAAFSQKPELIDALIKVEQSDDKEVIDKVEGEILFWGSKVRKS